MIVFKRTPLQFLGFRQRSFERVRVGFSSLSFLISPMRPRLPPHPSPHGTLFFLFYLPCAYDAAWLHSRVNVQSNPRFPTSAGNPSHTLIRYLLAPPSP